MNTAAARLLMALAIGLWSVLVGTAAGAAVAGFIPGRQVTPGFAETTLVHTLGFLFVGGLTGTACWILLDTWLDRRARRRWPTIWPTFVVAVLFKSMVVGVPWDLSTSETIWYIAYFLSFDPLGWEVASWVVYDVLRVVPNYAPSPTQQYATAAALVPMFGLQAATMTFVLKQLRGRLRGRLRARQTRPNMSVDG